MARASAPFRIVRPLALAAATSLLAGGVLGLVRPAAAQPAPGLEEGATNLDRLRDFNHFVRIGNYEVARAVAEALIGSGITEEEFVDLVEQAGEAARFERAVAEAMRVPDLEDAAAALDALFREGKLARARNPEEIARNIALLTDTLRARSLARERLLAAGEYAMPQLLEALVQQANPALQAQAQRVVVDMGRQAIAPLCTALPGLDPARQQQVCDVLGLIQYRTSLPALTELAQTTTVDGVRQAASRAIERLGGMVNDDVSELYHLLGDAYYAERLELTSFPDEDMQLLWSYDPGLGLRMTGIRTEVFHEAMAMRSAEKALTMNPARRDTVGLWIASNFSREIDQPEGTVNPAYGADRRAASYYAIAAGPSIGQSVLRRAMDDKDTQLALRAIEAISETAGPGSLVLENERGRFPLLESLAYPNKRVQYDAALALGKSQPRRTFTGSERVVPLLAGAVRDAGSKTAVVLTGRDRESYDRFAKVLAAQGFAVLPPAEGGLGDLAGAIAESAGVDLVVTVLGLEPTFAAVDAVRSDTKLAATPVLALTQADELDAARRRYGRDSSVQTRRSGIGDSEFIASVEGVMERASGGPIDAAEAERYASRSLDVLRDLAVSGNEVLNVTDSAAALIGVLESAGPDRADRIAEILSFVGQPRAQIAVAEKALSSEGGERLVLLDRVGASGRRFGNLLTPRLVGRISELATSDDEALATAAVAVLGSLGIENDGLVPMILGDRGPGGAPMAGGN